MPNIILLTKERVEEKMDTVSALFKLTVLWEERQ